MGEEMIEPSSDDARDSVPVKRRARRTALLAAGVTAAAGAVMVLTAVGTSSSAGAAPLPQITICHAQPANTAANGWTPVVVNEASIIHNNNHATHRLDIIPSFSYFGGNTYPGKNLDKVLRNGHTGAEILANNCVVPPRDSPTITICHARPPETAARGWIAVQVTEASVRFGHNHGAHALDIIPAFTFQNTDYPGKNLTTVFDGATGAQILANGCVIPPPAPPTDTSVAPPPVSTTAVQVVTQGPIPVGVNAGLHNPVQNAGLKSWGILLLLLGGAGGLLAGLWPSRRRAH
jgi:hypothetical protein